MSESYGYGYCSVCFSSYNLRHSKDNICQDCRDKKRMSYSKGKEKATLSEIARQASQKGMSYGQYVASMRNDRPIH